jgi:hypothetical protein
MTISNDNGIITRELFITALTEGMEIPPELDVDMHTFGSRLIDWINDTPNDYWACWSPTSSDGNIIIDLKNIEIINLRINPGRLMFLKPRNGAAEDLPKEFGNAAIGVMLFCMLEKGTIEQIEEEIPDSADEKNIEKPVPDFGWL